MIDIIMFIVVIILAIFSIGGYLGYRACKKQWRRFMAMPGASVGEITLAEDWLTDRKRKRGRNALSLGEFSKMVKSMPRPKPSAAPPKPYMGDRSVITGIPWRNCR